MDEDRRARLYVLAPVALLLLVSACLFYLVVIMGPVVENYLFPIAEILPGSEVERDGGLIIVHTKTFKHRQCHVLQVSNYVIDSIRLPVILLNELNTPAGSIVRPLGANSGTYTFSVPAKMTEALDLYFDTTYDCHGLWLTRQTLGPFPIPAAE